MKLVAKTAIASVVALALAGCGETATKVDLEQESQRHAYALGTVLGGEVKSNLEHLSSTGMELDKDVILAAISDAMNDESLMNEDEVQAAVMELVELSTSLAEAEAAAAGERNLEEGLAYQAENASRDGVTVTESGLQYEVMVEGEGPKPAATDTVTVHYKGELLDGTVFDSSYERGEPIAFPLDRVIVGWSEGVQLMNVGSKYRFVIPAELAYGDQQRPGSPIPPNATLIFEVELLEIEAAE
nr:FKBP-type peptidyl-prolyl cis-trans isomerase [Aliidiomarina taiwanensis]